eukprot:CAMPEP_0115285248 /NCGR_PEP_ID=MMETSP0270-20121206/61325_1 /TAXON_ID=71861 /ORGANISM="Scrippsiella trochoidea, Strain CCMP3099" /LENGTH=194 /DNA_ID=CAMNT_0002702249 /DNA_START=133 /DNA_END=717 /DNA_ORIENTATION=-
MNALPLACAGKVWDEGTIADWNLLRASADGDALAIHEALKLGADIETRGAGFIRPRSQKDIALPFKDSEGAQNGHMRGNGLTPLMRSAQEGHTKAVQTLLEACASPLAQDEDGMSPIHFAAQSGCRECCLLLMAAGSDPAALDDFGRDAFGCLPSSSTQTRAGLQEWEMLLRKVGGQQSDKQETPSSIFGQRLQ